MLCYFKAVLTALVRWIIHSTPGTRSFDMTDQSPIANQINSARTIRVSQGLFVLRYVSSKAGLNAPTVSVAAPPSSGVEVISPGGDGAQLVSPGDGLVIRA